MNWFSRTKSKTQVSSLFGEFLSMEVVEDAMTSMSNRLNELSEGPVEYVFAALDGATPNEIGRNLGMVATVACQNGWMVQGFLCNLVVLVHGMLPSMAPTTLDRAILVEKLLDVLPQKIKIVHGSEPAHYGQMGSAERRTFGFIISSFPQVLAALDSCQYGRAHAYHG